MALAVPDLTLSIVLKSGDGFDRGFVVIGGDEFDRDHMIGSFQKIDLVSLRHGIVFNRMRMRNECPGFPFVRRDERRGVTCRRWRCVNYGGKIQGLTWAWPA